MFIGRDNVTSKDVKEGCCLLFPSEGACFLNGINVFVPQKKKIEFAFVPRRGSGKRIAVKVKGLSLLFLEIDDFNKVILSSGVLGIEK